MSEILFLNPSYGHLIHAAEAMVEPLGPSYVAAYLRQQGEDVNIIDMTPLKLTMKDLPAIMKKENPSIVAMSSNTPLIGMTVEVAKEIKRIKPETKILLGGLHPTHLGKETFEYTDAIDVCVVGEGEISSLETVRALKDGTNLRKVNGIVFKDGEEIVSTPPRETIKNLDELPFPARDLLPMGKYHPAIKTYMATPFAAMITSRGCPFQCIFCAYSHGKIRYRSPENVVAEIKELKEKYKVKSILFYDETLTLNRERLMEICDLIVKEGIKVKWSCYSRVDTITAVMLKNMKKAGCRFVSYGIESGSERMLKIMKKGITLEKSRAAIKMTKEIGLETSTSFVLGIPGETKESVQKTIDFALELNPTFAHFNMVTPWPGTELYHKLIQEGRLDRNDWLNYTKKTRMHVPTIKLDNFSEDELQNMARNAYRKFYRRPSKMIQLALRVTSPSMAVAYLRAVLGYVDVMKKETKSAKHSAVLAQC